MLLKFVVSNNNFSIFAVLDNIFVKKKFYLKILNFLIILKKS